MPAIACLLSSKNTKISHACPVVKAIGEYLAGSAVFSNLYVRHLLPPPERFGNGSLQSSRRKAL